MWLLAYQLYKQRKKSVRTILIKDSNGSQKHVDDFFHVLMPLATSGIKRGEYQ